MAKFQTVEFDTEGLLEKLERSTDAIMSMTLYEGARVMADAIKEATPKKSGDLKDSLGIAKFDHKDGSVSTAISFEGYDRKGVANVLKARILERGRVNSNGVTVGKHPFIKNAVRKARGKSLEAMKRKFEELIQKIQK